MPEAVADLPEIKDVQSVGKGQSILIVDDEPMLRELLTEILDGDYKITSAADGREALGLLDKQSFGLIITDIMMPDVNGIEVLQNALKKDPDFPVIMITGYPSVDTAVKLINLGATDYIVKPFNVDMIRLTVAKTLALRQRLRGTGGTSSSGGAGWVGDGWTPAQFERLVTNEIARSELHGHKLSLMLLEIDDLNMYAGEGGTITADELVEKIAKLISDEVRPGDVFCMSDEGEWTVMLPETNREQAQAVAEKINSEAMMYASLSGGFSCYPWDGSNADALTDKARAALRLAKRKGGNQILSAG